VNRTAASRTDRHDRGRPFPSQPVRGGARRGPGCLALLLRGAFLLLLLYLFLRFAGPPLLQAYAGWLVVQDPVRPSDAAVALSGGEGERLLAAIELYKRREARALLIVGPDVPLLKVYTREDSLTQAEAKRRIAVRRGIPPDSVFVALGPSSTYEEAERSLQEARDRGWRTLLIVTDPFHTRRARATFRHVFRGSGVHLAVYHLPEGRSSQSRIRWWRRESDLMAVFTETVKMVFYAVHHHVNPWG
jgi:uncharacterized SAM-binding protein YcdF (DUF218 family)